MIKFNRFNLTLMARRAIGIALAFMTIYLVGLFFIKSIFYVLYTGTTLIDGLFKFLVRWWDWKIVIVILATKNLILLVLQDTEQCTEIGKRIAR